MEYKADLEMMHWLVMDRDTKELTNGWQGRRHKRNPKPKTLINGFALYQLHHKCQVVDAPAPEKNQISEDIVCTCKLE